MTVDQCRPALPGVFSIPALGPVPSGARWQPRSPAAPAPVDRAAGGLLKRAAVTRVEVRRRPSSVYDELTGTRPFAIKPSTKESP
ncbi:hypothetical protein [Streptomyces sp. NPDC059828]|uniref:hypothetical protein n=1 Tax=Streptomyces sp. NPDC059828 TaxID=3346965 RepID=UPI00366108C0